MSSCFTYMPESMEQTSVFGTSRPLPIWLQFVPGTVYKVNTSDLADGGYTGINSILAIPDVVDSSENSGSPKVYFPLLLQLGGADAFLHLVIFLLGINSSHLVKAPQHPSCLPGTFV